MKYVSCCYTRFEFALFCLCIVDNPMVVLGHRQGSIEILDHMGKNGDGDHKLEIYPAVDLRDLTMEKYKEVSQVAEYSDAFANIESDGIETCFSNIKAYAKAVIISNVYCIQELGYVNNCPFQGEQNAEYRMDLGEINEQLRGLSFCSLKSEILFKKCFHYSFDLCLIVLGRFRTV